VTGTAPPPPADLPPSLDLLVIGDCNPDVLALGRDVTPAFGQQEKLVDSISLVVGGSASITAVAAARLGLRVGLAAVVGDDPAGEFMLAQLTAAGVDCSAVTIQHGAATGMTVALSNGTDRAILTALGAMPTLTVADVPEALLSRARHVHVSSYFLLERTLGPGLASLLAAARRGGARTSLDTNWDPAERWTDDQLRGVLAHVDLLLPNEAEAMLLSGEADLPRAVAALTGMGLRLVVKRGAHGALCADGGRGAQLVPVAAPALPEGEVVDTTGAGDCFNAGLIAGLLRDLDLPAAARLGCAVATLSTRAAGGTGATPGLAEALRLTEAG
jgi:sugar/nucleoside kinase (ribokinase family)